uniref:3-oxoacyl-[acyl-carrier-protein] synthase III n=1 Tax=Candidatus Kentrum sp. TC TaxID=2126339 RepID=A0A450Y753_9GAMM|nr:MAG: 3-oxoacyl-[acyl-carrier-protein] synthase III [Candidatus Kentron sp. TC]
MRYSCILGTGHYLPPKVVSNFDVMKVMETSNEFIVKGTGVHYRRYAEPDMSASTLAVPACKAAIEDAGLQMEDIDFLIMNTITPDHADPGCAFFLQDKLGLPGIGVLDIRQQCAGLIYGLSIADHFVRADTYRHVLVVCSEILSKRVDASYDGRNLAILLGDGAGAVVVGASNNRKEKILSTILHADGNGAKVLYTAAPGSALGRSEYITKDDIDTGRVHFRMNGKAMFENGVARISEAIFESLEMNSMTLNDINAIIPHQPNLRMLEAIVERVGIPQDKTFINVQEYGNIASASLPIALDQARVKGVVTNGSIVLLVAFGSGFVWGSSLLRM